METDGVLMINRHESKEMLVVNDWLNDKYDLTYIRCYVFTIRAWFLFIYILVWEYFLKRVPSMACPPFFQNLRVGVPVSFRVSLSILHFDGILSWFLIVCCCRMFTGSCKRLRIMKSSDAIGLGMTSKSIKYPSIDVSNTQNPIARSYEPNEYKLHSSAYKIKTSKIRIS